LISSFSVLSLNSIKIFVYQLNKQSTLENVYIHPIIKIVVAWKVLVCREEEEKKKRSFFILVSSMSFVIWINHSISNSFWWPCSYRLSIKFLFFIFSDETGGGGSSSSSPSPTLKKHSDLTLRKVRRHVIQLSQHWKNANNNIQYRLKILQRAQTVEFKKKENII
jgi:hypothetical protein